MLQRYLKTRVIIKIVVPFPPLSAEYRYWYAVHRYYTQIPDSAPSFN